MEEVDQLKAEIQNLRSRSRSESVFRPRANTVQEADSSWTKLPKTLKPTAQLNAESFLGRALFGPKERRGQRDPEPSDEPSSSPSSESSDDLSSMNSRRRKKKRGKHQRMIIKPVAPETYDGSPDTHLFHKFISQATNYLKDGRVSERRKVSMITRHLTGKAYEFYVRKVAYDPERWSLQHFFQELFDYCFPVNFLGLLRKNFTKCRQGTRTVREFVYELNELCMMIGDIDDRARVNRLWFGCRLDIQKELWLKRLNPEVSNFETVAAAAETIELANGVAERSQTMAHPKPDGQVQVNNLKKKGYYNKDKTPRTTTQPAVETASKPPHQNTQRDQKPSTSYQKRPFSKKTKPQKPFLTEKERAEYKAQGRCFKCGAQGHRANDCPDSDIVKSSEKSDQPPGVRNNAITLEETAYLEDLADATETIDCLSLSLITQELPSDEGLGTDSSGESELAPRLILPRFRTSNRIEDPLGARVEEVLERNAPYPGDDIAPNKDPTSGRFVCYQVLNREWVVWDLWWTTEEDGFVLNLDQLLHPRFDVAGWFKKMRQEHSSPGPSQSKDDEFPENLLTEFWKQAGVTGLVCMAQKIDGTSPRSVQRNASRAKDFARKVPKPIVVVIKVNDKPTRALMDSGSLGDFMSTTLADQIKVKKILLEKPLSVQLAVQGSRTRANYGTKVNIKYQNINCERYFDIINLDGYDLILGTPFMFQHKVTIGLNDPKVIIGSAVPLPIQGGNVAELTSKAVDVLETRIEKARQELRAYAEPLCKRAVNTSLPPLRAINHKIPLIEEKRAYSWRPSRCPEAMRHLWITKRDAYLSSGRWKMAMGSNACPMLLIKKPAPPGAPLKLRTVVDLRERNANTKKVATPLPDIHTVLSRVASKRYRSLMDGQDAYEQIRVDPADVHKTLMTTPDGTMVSEVLQQGDTNAVATFMAVMTNLFLPFIGVWLEIYLDDIVIYTDTLEEHIQRVKQVIDTLRRENFYLSADKLHFLPDELRLLGHLITSDGIKLDPFKVDSIVAWKTPTSKEALRRFLGSVGYLTSNLSHVRIPMGTLSALTGEATPFRWTFTEQRAFDDIIRIVHDARDLARITIDYTTGAPPINLITDGCSIGIAGCISQGDDWRTAPVVTFYSAKLSSAQQNYAVHEIELLAGVETMVRYRHLLLGAKFRWYTDHKGLIYLLKQKGLTGRQARWMEKIGEFDFEVHYVPGEQNVLADALSRMYSEDKAGTVRAVSEYAQHDGSHLTASSIAISAPLLVGPEAEADILKTRKGPGPPETGRPETSKEFSKRIRRVRLLVSPKDGQEGEGLTTTTSVNLQLVPRYLEVFECL
jgi:hypothetical protein